MVTKTAPTDLMGPVVSDAFSSSPASLSAKLDNFPKYVRRQSLARFLARYELFKLQLPVAGSIVECGVFHGGGLLTWAKLSSALEPYAIHRRIYGFDTFEGLTEPSEHDTGSEFNAARAAGAFDTGYDVYNELMTAIAEYDSNRFLAEFKKVYLCRGDAVHTIPQFIQQNPHVLVSLLFLDFDIYAPTRIALECFLPRMAKGSVLAFDEIDNAWWPGETLALLQTLGVTRHRTNRFPMDPNISYIVL
jgi:Macrocin-O-methyltransferase (TylF)